MYIQVDEKIGTYVKKQRITIYNVFIQVELIEIVHSFRSLLYTICNTKLYNTLVFFVPLVIFTFSFQVKILHVGKSNVFLLFFLKSESFSSKVFIPGRCMCHNFLNKRRLKNKQTQPKC